MAENGPAASVDPGPAPSGDAVEPGPTQLKCLDETWVPHWRQPSSARARGVIHRMTCMKTIELHTPSLVIGGVAAILLSMTMGAAQVTHAPTAPQLSGPNDVRPGGNQDRPFARDLVYLRHDDPLYTVPTGKILVLVSIGQTEAVAQCNGCQEQATLQINGMPTFYTFTGPQLTQSMGSGMPLPAGSTVDVSYSSSSPHAAYVTGYLEDA